MSKLIFGCGYLGGRVAQLWQSAGEQVAVVTRSPDKARAFLAAGMQPIVADITEPASLRDLPPADTVLFAVGSDRSGGKSIRQVNVEGLRGVLDALPDSIGRFIYVSSTGVYAQTSGEWVDELSPCEPRREGGQAALAAEQLLAAHALGSRSIVLRMAGIYGPDRIPLAESIRAGEPIAAPAAGHLNLVHVDDAARIVLAAERTERFPALYCVSDGQPTLRGEYYQHLARLLGAPAPTFVPAEPGSPAAGRAESDKRVSNVRVVAELHVRFTYPSFREGLSAIVAQAPSGGC